MNSFMPKVCLSILAGAFLSLSLVSCDEVLDEPLPEGFSFSFSPDEVTVPPAGGSVEIAFESPFAWTASTEAQWLTVSPKSGESGAVVLTVSLSENTTKDARSAALTITLPDKDYSEDLTVTQLAYEPTLILSKEEIELAAVASSYEVIVASTVEWTVEADVPWLSAAPETAGFGETRVVVNAGENPDIEPREGHLTFSGEDLKAVLTVKQMSAAPWLKLSENEVTLAKAGGSVEVTVSGNIAWTASEDAEWLSVTPESGEAGETTLKLTAPENPYSAAREAVVTVSGGNESVVLKVRQSATEAWLTLSQETAQVGKKGGNVAVKVSGNIDWTASADAQWISVEPASGSFGETAVVVKVAENAEPKDREGKVSFTGEGVTAVLTIKEDAASWLSLSQQKVTIVRAGGTAELKVSGNVEWTASADAEWISIAPASGKAGETAVVISVPMNPDTQERLGTVLFKAEDTEVSLSVSQEAAAHMALSKETASVEKDGGKVDVTLDANIDWTASVDADWLSVSPASGKSGQSAVTVTVAANPAPTARDASVTFSGEGKSVKLTIHQAETPAWITLTQTEASVEKTGGKVELSVSGNVDWTATADVQWISVAPASGKAGEQTAVVVTVAENTTPQDREGKLSFKAAGVPSVLTIKQAAASWLSLSQTEASIGKSGGTVEVTVSGNVAWTAASDVQWITLAPASGQAGDTKLTLTVAENAALEARSGKVTVTGAEGLTAVLTLTQDATPALSFSPASLTFAAAGGEAQLKITAAAAWTVTKPDTATWLTLSATSGSTGESTIVVSVPVNDAEQGRSAILQFTASGVTLSYSVSQKGKDEVGGISGDIDDWGDGGEGDYGRK